MKNISMLSQRDNKLNGVIRTLADVTFQQYCHRLFRGVSSNVMTFRALVDSLLSTVCEASWSWACWTYEFITTIIFWLGAIVNARPVVVNQVIKDPQWLAGFTSGEGSFLVRILKSSTHKIGAKAILRFQISQHSRDAELLKSLIKYLECGRCYSYGEESIFVVESFGPPPPAKLLHLFIYIYKK